MTTIKMGFITTIAFLFAGCAYTPQAADVAPNLQMVPSTVGQGHSVQLKILDERDNTIIGRRGSGMLRGAEITTSKPLDVVFYNAIADGLKQKGFVVDDQNTSAKLLKVELRSFEYDTSTGFFTGGIHTNAAIKAIASDQNDEYTNLFRYDGEKRVVFIPGSNKNEQLINNMANGLLQAMFNDAKLIEFLAR